MTTDDGGEAVDLNEKIQIRRNERKQQEGQKQEEERIEKHKEWVQSGGRKRMAKVTAKLVLLPLYALVLGGLWLVVWSLKSLLF